MTTERQDHWHRVYSEKQPEAVSWYQPSPAASLDALSRSGADSSRSLIDVGGGASKLVDVLLARGWRDLTVLDIAAPALAVAQARLGEYAATVAWEVADITTWHPPRRYGIWHDRAVFHFLTEPAQRAAYLRALDEGLEPGGMVIIATFALDGPDMCSGLAVERYDADKLVATMGQRFSLVFDWRERHLTPWGSPQTFTWCVFQAQA